MERQWKKRETTVRIGDKLKIPIGTRACVEHPRWGKAVVTRARRDQIAVVIEIKPAFTSCSVTLRGDEGESIYLKSHECELLECVERGPVDHTRFDNVMIVDDLTCAAKPPPEVLEKVKKFYEENIAGSPNFKSFVVLDRGYDLAKTPHLEKGYSIGCTTQPEKLKTVEQEKLKEKTEKQDELDFFMNKGRWAR